MATAALSAASADHGPPSPPPIPPDAVLTWITNAVNVVRASSPSKFQVEGRIYTLTTNRQYGNVQDIQNEIVDARVWAGLHFRNSVEQGENLGNQVAAYDLDQAFQPVHH